MPTFRGIPFVWRAASRLRPGDEVLLDSGAVAFISAAYDDGYDGTWLEISDGGSVIDCGYASGRYRVIH